MSAFRILIFVIYFYHKLLTTAKMYGFMVVCIVVWLGQLHVYVYHHTMNRSINTVI